MTLYQYTRDIPDGPHNPSTDQPDLKLNTNNTDDIFNEDHFSFNVNNGGLHKHTRMPLSNGAPGSIPAGLIANSGTLYTKTVTSTAGNTETGLFYTPDNSGNEYQMTRTITSGFTLFGKNLPYGTPPAGVTQTGGWTFLPGGLIFQYGYIEAAAIPITGIIQFPISFNSNPFSISVTSQATTAALSVVADSVIPSITDFHYIGTANTRRIYWSAIGF